MTLIQRILEETKAYSAGEILGPWGPPNLLYNGYRVFPGGKAAGAWR